MKLIIEFRYHNERSFRMSIRWGASPAYQSMLIDGAESIIQDGFKEVLKFECIHIKDKVARVRAISGDNELMLDINDGVALEIPVSFSLDALRDKIKRNPSSFGIPQ